ncbi:MAG TPA: chemotaxis protein CheA [Terriglobales bacterium]|nr:chemotaxis protein CheA [Terriglobales bacterium]
MSFFSEEHGAELKELFFESAQELLQALNEEGLMLEKRPGDTEIVRSVRRTVHTLKGDSAACGFRELSELAHQLEDVLTPELAAGKGSLGEVVLAAADTFQAMLAAYRGNLQPPSGAELRSHIEKLMHPAEAKPAVLAPKFAWSEYEQMMIADAASRGLTVYNIALRVDPQCGLQAAAIQLVRNVLRQTGTLLAMRPEGEAPAAGVEVIEAAVSSAQNEEWVAGRCRIPAVIAEVLVQRCRTEPITRPEHDLLGLTPEPPVITVASAAATPTETPAEPAGEAAAPAGEAAGAEAGAAPAAFTTTPETTLRVDAERIDAVLNLVGELIIGKSMLHQTVGEFDKRFPKDGLRGKFADAMAFQARVLQDLQKSVMKIRMVPVEQLFRRLPRVIRDLAKEEGKEVALQVSGQDTDLDKSIVDMLAEPMTHLVRNAVDHGLETPAERVAAGKPAAGTVRLNAYHQGNQVVIEVSDDGRGIDRRKVVAQAVERGILKAEEAPRLSEAEALDLIFHPGLSTASEVTQISGRGVGMDVVRSVLERLKGTVQIETRAGQGTTFLLKVPLTLAIIKALLFRAADRLYAVPLASVLEIARTADGEFHKVDNHEVWQLRDQILTLVRLGRLAGRGRAARNKRLFVVVIAMGDRRFGLVVDQLVGEEELVIKALDDNLVATDLVSGASILGDGAVVLILNIPAVIARLGKSAGAALPGART